MPDDRTLPLQTLAPKPADEDLRNHLANGSALLAYLKRLVVVDAGEIIRASSVVVSGVEPGASDRGKLWVNRTEQFIAVWSGSKWVKLYFHGYPELTPFKYCGAKVPTFLRKLTTTQVQAEGLSETGECPWVIFDPENNSIL